MKLTMGMLLTNLRRNIGSGPTLATLPITPTARWNAHFSAVTESGGRVTAATDLQGLAGVTEGSTGTGPFAMTDATGRKFWRFEGAEWLTVAAGLVHDIRNMSVFFVGRIHRQQNSFAVYSAGVNGTTAVNAGAAAQAVIATSAAGHWWTAHGASGGVITGLEAKMETEAGIQVAGMCSRTTALGGRRILVNEVAGNTTQATGSSTGVAGGEIGRYSWTPGSSGNWATMDLYEMVVYTAALNDAESNAVQAALVASYAIQPKVNQLVLEGDSIMQGTVLVTSGISAAMRITDPGAALVPSNWKVINRGVSGAAIADLVTRRDVANGWANWLLPGKNVVAFEIGRNDWSTQSETQEYTSVVAYINTATTGLLQRGWTVRAMANIGTGPTYQAKVVPFRALLRNSQFLTDTLSGPGQAYEGKVSVINTDMITYAGATIFEDSTDANDVTYYQGDNTHPNALGALLRVNGGTTPQYGIAYGLT